MSYQDYQDFAIDASNARGNLAAEFGKAKKCLSRLFIKLLVEIA